MGKLIVVRNKKRLNGFTIVDNAYVRTKDLSLKAKGLLTFLLALPPEWEISNRALSDMLPEAQATVCGILEELKEKGYLKVDLVNTGHGRKSTWTVYENGNATNLTSDMVYYSGKASDVEHIVKIL